MKNNYGLRLLQSAHAQLSRATSTKQVALLRPFMPYQFVKTHAGYLPVNRDYKPLGLESHSWENYEDWDFLMLPHEQVSEGLLLQDCYMFTDKTSPFVNLNNQRVYTEMLGDMIAFAKDHMDVEIE